MDYCEEDVHGLSDAALGRRIRIRLEGRRVKFIELVLVRNRRTMRVWYVSLFDAGDFEGEPCEE